MFTQGYGDRTMALWGTILSTLGNVVAPLIANKMAVKQGESSPEYKNAFNAANESIGKAQGLADQYTGNQGYANSLEQAGIGAGKVANQAVGTATNAARSAGMSKAQAAQMGLQSANQMYGSAFGQQQSNAAGMGNQAIAAQQGVTSAQQGQAGQAASEKQSKYNRQKDTLGTISNAVGNALGTGM